MSLNNFQENFFAENFFAENFFCGENLLRGKFFMENDFRLEELKILEEIYRGAVPELKFNSPFELLIAVILSAQCTDKRVNQVTKILFQKANTPEKILRLGQIELEKIIKPCGFFKTKANHIVESSKILPFFNDKLSNSTHVLENKRKLAPMGKFGNFGWGSCAIREPT